MALDNAWFRAKLYLMILLILIDIILNSSVEYDDYERADNSGDTLLALILGLQMFVQISIFLSLFVMMFDTYPFRVGLMGLLVYQYMSAYLVNAVYLLMTGLIYGTKVTIMIRNDGLGIWEIWDLPAYAPFSILHKLVASISYVTNMRAAFKLGDPQFYRKDAWVQFQNRGPG